MLQGISLPYKSCPGSLQPRLLADGKGAVAVLLGKGNDSIAPESEADDGDEGLAKLLTPGRMPDSTSTARFNLADAAPGASPSQNADAAMSAGPSTSESRQETCRLPPELAKEPPGLVDPAIQVCNNQLPTCLVSAKTI